jgi:Ca2+-binding RTX toxin-like protein
VTVETVFSSAELAFAAYAVLQPGLTSNQIAALQNDGQGLSLKQAQEFALRYPDVIAQVNDAASGFSLTAFRDTGGAISLAVRGTDQLLTDWFATNTSIAINGAGYQQIAALYNTWQRLTHRLGETITVYSVDLSNVANPVVAQTVVNDLGTAAAPLISPGAAVDVAGHSLGGHLALAFAGLFPINARQVHAFNAPGFIDSTLNRNFFARLGGQLPLGISPGGVPTFNVIADAQVGAGESFSAVAGLHSCPGMAINIAIENQAPPTDEPNPPFSTLNHSQMILTDSLAVFALLERLAPSLSAASLESLLGSAALGTAGSLERIVDALAQTLGMNRSPLPTGNANRNALYEAIYAVRSNAVYLALEGSAALRVLAETDAATLEANAKSDFGYFLALKGLLPIAFEGSGSPLIAAHADLYARWSADRARRIAGAGELEFTDAYHADRAQMLAFLNTANTNDTNAFASNQVSDQVLYRDLVTRPVAGSAEGRPTELLVFLPGGTPNFRGPNTRIVEFGTDAADALRGRDNTDRLYAGRGTDALTGGKANDFLEGGAGLDLYQYNALPGILGIGSSNDGDDEIRDTDGKGVLRYTYGSAQGTVIGGAALRVSATQWTSPDGKFTYDQQGSNGLLVTINGDAGGSLMLREFDFAKAQSEGYLGIRLVDSRARPTDLRTPELMGDLQLLDNDPNQSGLQLLTSP